MDSGQKTPNINEKDLKNEASEKKLFVTNKTNKDRARYELEKAPQKEGFQLIKFIRELPQHFVPRNDKT